MSNFGPIFGPFDNDSGVLILRFSRAFVFKHLLLSAGKMSSSLKRNQPLRVTLVANLELFWCPFGV